MGRVLAAFREGSPPYVLTLFLGALAWYVTHVVDRAHETPLVEQRISVGSILAGQSERRATLKLENLSNELFRNTRFQILFSGRSGDVTRIEPPVALAPAAPMTDQPSTGNNAMAFTLQRLQPRDQLQLIFYYRGDGIPYLVLMDAGAPLVLVEPNMETFFVRHEFAILMGLIVVFGLFTAAVVVASPRTLNP